ncbi:hypothetical protein FRC04_004774 [Tulasnella sp. 424]|nr:hypothetical protein FRC04_004774 [Tulasnella sp. 424]KAG8976296.1 hypothetical protein FRC05_004212 [Tulasnella sp. 425]
MSSASTSSSGSPVSATPLTLNTLNRYFMELHNMQQRGEIAYKEDITRQGTANAPTWSCYITIESLHPTYNQAKVGETYWDNADKKQAARDLAARLVLQNINFGGIVH